MSARDDGLLHEAITRSIIGAFFELYSELGFGFLESVYAAGMEVLLRERGHIVEREVRVSVYLRGRIISRQKIDMLVDKCVALEFKSSVKLPVETKRVLYNYLHGTRLEVGLILHFGLEPRFYRIVCTNK